MSLNGMSDAEIRKVTGISERSLKRLRSVYRKTGGVVPPPPLETGRPRTLTAIHVKVRYDTQRLDPRLPISLCTQYLCDCVERRRDVPLSELRTELREVFDVNVSVQTVSRSLQRVGVCKENGASVMYTFSSRLSHNFHDSPCAPLITLLTNAQVRRPFHISHPLDWLALYRAAFHSKTELASALVPLFPIFFLLST
jgi:transposase